MYRLIDVFLGKIYRIREYSPYSKRYDAFQTKGLKFRSEIDGGAASDFLAGRPVGFKILFGNDFPTDDVIEIFLEIAAQLHSQRFVGCQADDPLAQSGLGGEK